jgi:hydrogenase maturation factor
VSYLPLGKLPPDLLESIINKAPISDRRVVLGPGTGLDCAVIDNGDKYLVIKTDPITFTTENIGWYAVQINVNDIMTTGAIPIWMMASILLPEKQTTVALVERISNQLFEACHDLNISFIGGHTEITYDIHRPIIAATMLGEVEKTKFISPKGMNIGDKILLTKGIPIEATAIIAQDFKDSLSKVLTPRELQLAKNYLIKPGISIYKDASISQSCGGVTAMHDPTEGGLAAALWELSIASHKTIQFYPDQVYIPDVSQKICRYFGLNPLNTISSGALLMTVSPEYSQQIINKLNDNQIICNEIGLVSAEGEEVLVFEKNKYSKLERPERDELAKLFEENKNVDRPDQ